SVEPSRPPPVPEVRDDDDGEPRGDGSAHASPQGNDAAGEPALVPLGPAGQQSAADRVGPRFGESTPDAGEQQGHHPTGEPRRDGEGGPQQNVEGHQGTRPETHREIPGGDLSEGVGGEKGSLDPAVGDRVEWYVLFERGR